MPSPGQTNKHQKHLQTLYLVSLNLLILSDTMVSCYNNLSSHECMHINLERVLNDRE